MLVRLHALHRAKGFPVGTIALAVAALALLPARADAHMSCSAGKTLFHEGKTRVFQSRDRTSWYVCSAWLRRPRLFAEGNEGALDATYAFRRTGRRVAFVWNWVGGDDLGWGASWVDVSSGRSKYVEVNPVFDLPDGEGETVVAGADGSVAFVEKVDGGGLAIGYAPFAAGRFGSPRVLVSDADVVPASLSLRGTTIVWQTTAGAHMSAQVDAVAAQAVTCESGKTLFSDADARVFRDGNDVYLCSATATAPVRVLDASYTTRLDVFRRFGDRIALADTWVDGVAAGFEAGWLDDRTGAIHFSGDSSDTLPFGRVQFAAVGRSGSVAALVRPPDRRSQLVVYARFGGGQLGTPRVIARVPAGDAVPSSLRVAGGKVVWRTRAGRHTSARVSAVAAAASSTVTIIGARATIASAATPSPTTRASTTRPSPSLDSVS